MSKCPKLKYKDTGWFSWRYYCEFTGQLVGDENHKERVDNVCNSDHGCKWDQCPIYKKFHG